MFSFGVLVGIISNLTHNFTSIYNIIRMKYILDSQNIMMKYKVLSHKKALNLNEIWMEKKHPLLSTFIWYNLNLFKYLKKN